MCAREAPNTPQAALLGIYTLTPTHCGTGKAMDAVDLPIAREEHTRHPVMPSSSVKGALRAAAERQMGGDAPPIKAWFGPEIRKTGERDKAEGGKGGDLFAGSVTFTDARMLAFPVRALHTAFCWVTCPLVLERFYRDLCAFELAELWPTNDVLHPASRTWSVTEERARVAVKLPALVLEDLAFADTDQVDAKAGIAALASAFGKMLGPSEEALRRRMAADLVVVSDEDFADLATRTMPVQARIRLNEKKTTTGGGGNLWYEETLPSDALFSAFALARDGADPRHDLGTWLTSFRAGDGPAGIFRRPVQIGGNETVGQGLCLWHVAREVSRGR